MTRETFRAGAYVSGRGRLAAGLAAGAVAGWLGGVATEKMATSVPPRVSQCEQLVREGVERGLLLELPTGQLAWVE